MNMPSIQDEELHRLFKETFSIIKKLLGFYTKDETLLIHKGRALRSLLHGYVSLCFLGYFQNPVSLEDSFQFMLDDFILSISRI
jgi:hypothetical protein